MASSASSASAERNPLEKKFNSQTKYLLMKLWEYCKQEAKKCKISINITERISKATSIVCNAFFAGFWYTLFHAGISRTSIVRVTMEHCKKGGLSMPRKRYKKHFAQARLIVIVRYKCSRVHVDADSFDRDSTRQDPFIVRKEGNLSLSKIWQVNFEPWNFVTYSVLGQT